MHAESPPPRQRRVFLALWPDDAVRDALAEHARSLAGSGRPVPREHLHLTLAFAGTIPEPRVACLRERIGELQTAPIPLHLDRLGHFARARVTWIGPRRVPAALEALATRATELCSACGTPVHTDVFRPHVTLRRYASHPEHEIASPPVDWDAREVVLIESGDAGRPGPYRILARTGISSSESPGS